MPVVPTAEWPKLQTEERPWVPTIPPGLVSAAVRQRHSGPYRAAVVPKIEFLTPHLSPSVLGLADGASREVARFDAELGREVAPFSSVLLRTESASSSRIENLTSSARAIALAEIGDTARRNAVEIVGNVRAMTAALRLAERLDVDAVLAMHEALLGHLEPHSSGRWRREQVWIGGTTFGPHIAEFVPPHHDHVEALMADLLAFARRSDLPVFVQAAIAHAQFETIHPFVDGNGRTGRALVHALLRHHGVTRNVTVPVSAGLLTNTGAYFESLSAYREGNPAAIVEQFAEATFRATMNGRQLVTELNDIRTRWDAVVHARRGARAWQLADLLLRQPVVDLSTVAANLGVAPANAQRAISPLVDAGVLIEFTGYRRNRMWQAAEVLSALDDFAARAGRRTAG